MPQRDTDERHVLLFHISHPVIKQSEEAYMDGIFAASARRSSKARIPQAGGVAVTEESQQGSLPPLKNTCHAHYRFRISSWALVRFRPAGVSCRVLKAFAVWRHGLLMKGAARGPFRHLPSHSPAVFATSVNSTRTSASLEPRY